MLDKASIEGVHVVELSLGVVSQSRKENERRLPIHPLHVERIEPALRQRIYLEHGYGEAYGVSDEHLASLVGGMRTREQLVGECDVMLLAKPVLDDVAELREGQVRCSWSTTTCPLSDRVPSLSTSPATRGWASAGRPRSTARGRRPRTSAP